MYRLSTRSHYKTQFFVVLLALISSLVFADADSPSIESSMLDYSNLGSQGDKSYQFLAYIFGTVSSDLVCSTSGCTMLVPFFFKLLNQGILIIGSSLLSYLVFMGTALSAHEGEVFGKRLSTFWVPLKTTAALAFLVPTQTGYSLLQGLIIKVVLMGVALSNYLYGTLINYAQGYGVSISVESSSSNTSTQPSLNVLMNVKMLVSQMALANYCQAYFNSIDGNASLPKDTLIEDNILSSIIEDGSTLQEYTIGYGYPAEPYYCGMITVQADSGYGESVLTIANNTIAGLAPSWINDYKYSTDTVDNIDKAHIKDLNSVIETVVLSLQMGSFESSNKTSITNTYYDWLDFPENFYKLLEGFNHNSSAAQATLNTAEQKTNDTPISNNCAVGIATFKAKVSKQLSIPAYPVSELLSSMIPSANRGGAIGYISSTITQMLKGDEDPLITLSKYGQGLLQSAYSGLLAIFISVIAIMGISAICSAVSSSFAVGVSMALGAILSGMISIFGFMLPTGVLLGIYLPMMPLMMFALGVMGWFLQVVEAMVAGPIIALGLIAPGQGNEGLGKLMQAVMLLANIFLRPALMIVGAVMGAKAFALFAGYMTTALLYSFKAVGQASQAPWFGLMFIIYWMMYCAFIVSVAQRCYALIYILPDKVLSWIGGHTPSIGREISEDLRALQSEASKGGDSLGKELSGGVNTVNKGATNYFKAKGAI